MKLSINNDIALTHIVTRKKQTFVAALGVTIGVAIYLFMNSLSSGFTNFSRDNIFQSNAHIKIYKSDELSKPLQENPKAITVIHNPQITTTSKTIINPQALLYRVKQEPYITNAVVQVDFVAFYNRGKTQIKGSGNGVNMLEYSNMFNTNKYMVAGSIQDLQGNLNGIIIGKGIAEKLSLGLGDNITVSSSYGVSKVLRIVGIFNMGNSLMDDSKSFVNISTAQQFLKENASFVTTIYANTLDADKTLGFVEKLQSLTEYRVEDWQTTNADVISGDKTRRAMMGAISLSILLVASFGIYNILSATITQKINDIAILKAMGFKGGDVIKIFVSEAFIMGIIGTVIGLCCGAILITIMSKVYMGPPVGYFPIKIEPKLFAQSFILGIFITFCAGYFPARKAANVDPVEIFRK
ncbi:MAG: ABC transporter permease [Raineya sp.]|jgi:lipoprotein-releasing system permease protein|nr:ABC transporter permease [Raineya sp.]